MMSWICCSDFIVNTGADSLIPLRKKNLIFRMDISVVVIIYTYHIRPWLKNTTMDGWFRLILLLFVHISLYFHLYFQFQFQQHTSFLLLVSIFIFCWYAKSCERASKKKKKRKRKVFHLIFNARKTFKFFYILQLKN